jgi:hypothetical protein
LPEQVSGLDKEKAMPRAVMAHQLGLIENYRLEEIALGEPGASDARVAIRAPSMQMTHSDRRGKVINRERMQ